MKEDIQHKTGKIYYSMGEVSEMFDVKPSLLRFWEQKFDIIKPHKNKKGNRLFTPEDVDNLKIIYHLVKEKGMTLAGAQMRMKENREGLRRDMEVVERLQNIKAVLMEIRQELKDDSDDAISIDTTDDNAVCETKYMVAEAIRQMSVAVEPIVGTTLQEEQKAIFELIDEQDEPDRQYEYYEQDEQKAAQEPEVVPFVQQTLF